MFTNGLLSYNAGMRHAVKGSRTPEGDMMGTKGNTGTHRTGHRFFSLKGKMFLTVLALVLIPIISLGAFAFRESRAIVLEKAEIGTLGSIRQIGRSMDLMFKEVHDTSLFLIQDDSVRAFFGLSAQDPDSKVDAARLKLLRILMYQISSKPFIHSIYFEGYNGIRMDTGNARLQLDDATRAEATALRGGFLWRSDTIVNYDGSESNTISSIRVVNDIYRLTRKLALLKINLDVPALDVLCQDPQFASDGAVCLVDWEGHVLAGNQNARKGTELVIPFPAGMAETGTAIIRMQGESWLVARHPLQEAPYTLVSMISLNRLWSASNAIPQAAVILMLASFAVCALFALLFSTFVLRPLERMRRSMMRIENEDFDVRVEVKGHDELAMLGHSINKMSAKLGEQIREVYLIGLRQREAELKSLQARVNPHFLYNALDTIYWMARMEKAYETGKLVEALSRLFRLSLGTGGVMTRLEEELEHLRNYLVIQERRYQDAVRFHLDIGEALENCRVVRLVIQPLVENALQHGIDRKDGCGNVWISVCHKEGQLLYEIRDDGAGMDMAEVPGLLSHEDESGRGFGLRNVNERIRLSFGEAYGLTIESRKGEGTTVRVRQPFQIGETESGTKEG